MKTSIKVMFQLNSDKYSFGVDNVQISSKIEAAIVKIQCFENKNDLFCILDENLSADLLKIN